MRRNPLSIPVLQVEVHRHLSGRASERRPAGPISCKAVVFISADRENLPNDANLTLRNERQLNGAAVGLRVALSQAKMLAPVDPAVSVEAIATASDLSQSGA